jgi:two-component system cell cycle response regulator
MKLQSKMTLTLLAVSLITAATVGVVAYGFLMRDFRQSVKDRAFKIFVEDITAYLNKYGSLENGAELEPFNQFVFRRRRPHRLPGYRGIPLRPGLPPFRFMILDPDGRVIREDAPHAPGQKVPDAVFEQSRPIEINGRTAVRVVQIGDPVLTEQDREYLTVMRKALAIGILVAGGLAVLLGLLLGRRLSATLRRLTHAIGSMSLEEEVQQELPVRSKDEIGMLTQAFNRMCSSLSQTHAELRKSHDQVQAQAHELRELSIRDSLTNLFNRRHFDAQAQILFNQALRYNHPLAVMIADLDHFKQINDRISHAVGDETLRRVAELILANTRKSDIAARYGGEEFVVVFSESTLEQAVKCCQNLLKRIEHHPWREVHPDLQVTVSMGLCDDIALGSLEKMLHKADERLYEAKKQGRNRVMPAVS